MKSRPRWQGVHSWWFNAMLSVVECDLQGCLVALS